MTMNDTPITIIGAGGHAHSIIDILRTPVAGYVAPQQSPQMPYTYLGDDAQYIATHLPTPQNPIHIAIISRADCSMQMRRHLLRQYSRYSRPAIIADTAVIADTADVAQGCAILRLAYIGPGSVIAQDSIINTRATIEHNVTIGTNTFVAPGAIICGGVHIGDNCYIGAGTIVRNNVTIGDNITTGIGTIVTKDLTQEGTYIGNPVHPYIRK